MKKTIIYLSVALCTVMVSCGGGAEADADKMCDIYKRMDKAKNDRNIDELRKISEEFKTLGNELQEKYKTDREAQETISNRIKECSGME